MRSRWWRGELFPAAVALLSLLLVLAHRLLFSRAGLGFGMPGDGDRFATGILSHEIDNLSYASYMAQARLPGLHAFLNAHTLEPQGRIYFNPIFLVAGKLAAALDVPAFGVLVCLGLVAMCAVILLTYHNARAAGLSVAAARWATVLVAFASGLSSHVSLLLGRPVSGADVSFQDALTFSSFYAYPFHTIAYALLGVIIALVLALENGTARRAPALVALALTSAVVASSHPYEAVMLLASHACHVVLARRGLAVFAALALGCLPPTALNLWVSLQPAWRSFAEAALALLRARGFWLVGYGVVLPLALAGAALTLRRRPRAPASWLALWTVLLFVLLVVAHIKQTKIVAGGYLPLAIMAGAAIAELGDRIASRSLKLVAAAALAALAFPTSAQLYLREYRSITIDREVLGLAEEIARRSPASPAVVSDVTTSLELAAYAPVRVYASHWPNTPGFREKLGDLRSDLAAVVAKVHPDYVVLAREHPAFAAVARIMRPLRCLARTCLFSAGSPE